MQTMRLVQSDNAQIFARRCATANIQRFIQQSRRSRDAKRPTLTRRTRTQPAKRPRRHMSLYDEYGRPRAPSQQQQSQSQQPLGHSARALHPGAVLLSPQTSASAGNSAGNSAGDDHTHQYSMDTETPGIASISSALDALALGAAPGIPPSRHSPQELHQPVPVSMGRPADEYHNNTPLTNLTNTHTHNPRQTNALDHAAAGSAAGHRAETSQYPYNGGTSTGTSAAASQQQVQPSRLMNLTQDISNICAWLGNLSSAQQNMVMDNVISALKDDVLQYTKLKLDSLINSGYLASPQQHPTISSPLSVPALSDLSTNSISASQSYSIPNLDAMFGTPPSSNVDNIQQQQRQQQQNMGYHPWSPQPVMSQGFNPREALSMQRPKSADPAARSLNQYTATSINNAQETQGSRHLNIHNSNNYNGEFQQGQSLMGSVAQNAGSGSTGPNASAYTNQEQNYQPMRTNARKSYMSVNSQDTYSSHQQTPPQQQQQQQHHAPQPYSYNATGLHSYNNFYSFTRSHQNKHRTQDDSGLHGQKNAANSSMNPSNLTNPKLLTDIPSWLKSLRLHKYSAILQNIYWEDLVELDDDYLTGHGVAALGARRKLLKAFGIVKEYKAAGKVDKSAFDESRKGTTVMLTPPPTSGEN